MMIGVTPASFDTSRKWTEGWSEISGHSTTAPHIISKRAAGNSLIEALSRAVAERLASARQRGQSLPDARKRAPAQSEERRCPDPAQQPLPENRGPRRSAARVRDLYLCPLWR